MRNQFNALKAKWENEKDAIGKVQKLREETGRPECRDRKSQRMSYDLNKAAELKYGRLPQSAG